MGQIKAGSAMPGAGGQGSFSNLQNAGAASAALTAAMAKGNLRKANEIIVAMRKFQAQARTDVQKGKMPDGSIIPNGLSPGGLEVYNPSGQVSAGNVPVTWSGVSSLAETRSGVSGASSAIVNIKQSTQNAYLYWNKFNVGPQTTVNFDQSAGGQNAGQWISFNKVMSASDPSHIFGNINAQGQVYILNQNGILFHNGSTVNTRSLVASTLPINPRLSGVPLGNATTPLAASGLMNNPKNQFLFSAVKNGDADPFTPDSAPVGGIGNVVVERGASISAPVDNNNSGGLVALIGPGIRNEGTIETPNGQTILAAGLQVILSPHPSVDPSLRGLDVSVGKVSDPSVTLRDVTTLAGGTALNAGMISAPLGSVMMAGKTIRQNGVIDSTTSVALNGRIDLMAVYDAAPNPAYTPDGPKVDPIIQTSTGTVEIGSFMVDGKNYGGLLRILPQYDSKDTVIGTTLPISSSISLLGNSVHFSGESELLAPGSIATTYQDGSHAVSLGRDLLSGVTIDAGSWSFQNGRNVLLHDSGQIYLDAGAVIDVSGSTGVLVDSAQNYLTLQLRGAELANSPLQRTSAVRGKDITVDIRNTGSYDGQYWVGTPLGDVTGYVGLIQRAVGQLTVNGGSVSMAAGDSVVIQGASGATPAASINVSGGWVQYSGGTFSTSKLHSSTGQIVDISKATPDQVYTEIVKSSASYYEAPYLSGGNGGSLLILSPALALDGSLEGLTVAGTRQLRTTPSSGASAIPSSSTLNLRIGREVGSIKGGIALVSPHAPTITFSSVNPSLLAVPDSFSTEMSFSLQPTRNKEVFLDPALLSTSGFGNFSLDNHDGSIVIPEGILLNAGAGGSVIFKASTVSVEGDISAPGGTVSISAYRVSSGLLRAMSETGLTRGAAAWTDALLLDGKNVLQYGTADSGGMISVLHEDGTYGSVSSSSTVISRSGGVELGAKATISTAGLLVNGMVSCTEPIAITGGGISISGYNVSLAKGALIDVSGGALLMTTGKITYGDAGKLSISGGSDVQVADLHHGMLRLGATLYGFAGLQPGGTGGKPGALELAAPAIELGGETSGQKLGLNAAFFNQGGFGTFNLTGVGMEIPGTLDFVPGISIAPGATIRPSIQSYRLLWSGTAPVLSMYSPDGSFGFAPSMALKATGLKDDGLSDGSKYLIRGDVVMGEGSSVILDPGVTLQGGIPSASVGALTIRGNTIDIEGNIIVAGGSMVIADQLADTDKAVGFKPNEQKPLVPYATVVIGSTARISTEGVVLYTPDPKGIRARFGTVISGGDITIGGNLLARNGSTIKASGASAIFDDFRFSSYTVDAAGGAITLSGRQFLYSDAMLISSAGGSTATGGNLIMQSGRFYNEDETQYPGDLNLSVGQSTRWTTGLPALGSLVGFTPAPSGGISEGGGHVSVSTFAGGGFHSLTLGGKVLFSGGDVSISLPGNLVVATQGVLESAGKVQLSAAHLSLGMPFAPPLQDSDPNKVSVFTANLSSDNNLNYVAPSWGAGRIYASASLIDLGNLALRSIGTADLEAGGGAIRGDGTFVMAGDLTLAAREVYPVSGVMFEAVAFSHDSTGKPSSGPTATPGSIKVMNPSGLAPSLPLSAGGGIQFFAASIQQQGNLLAPFGQITLGGSSAGGKDPVSGIVAPSAANVLLASGSVTSVSGSGLVVPFGTSADGTTWTDVAGTDITSVGPVGKSITIAGASVTTAMDSTLNLSGGGTLDAFRWISGLGGTINLVGSPTGSWSSGASYNTGDLVTYNGSPWSARLMSTGKTPVVGPYWSKVAQAFSILPGYDFQFAPTGYADGLVKVGDRVLINSGGGLASGSYTLLPATYANLPGAYLISVNSTSRETRLPISIANPDGSVQVSGTIYNDLLGNRTAAKDSTLFTLFKPSALASKVQYGILNADEFFKQAKSPKPKDAGNALVASSGALNVNGRIMGMASSGGEGSAIDLSAPGSFVIGSGPASVRLDPSLLAGWSYGSLLIGGSRDAVSSSETTPVSVAADSIALDPGVNLEGSDLILAARNGIQFGDHSGITAGITGTAPDENITISGNGVFVRVCDDSKVTVSRSDISSGPQYLSFGENVSLRGASVILDSSSSLRISPSTTLNASSVALNAGAVALVLDNKITDVPSGRVVLSGSTLDGLTVAKNLNITSYSTLDIYGAGSFGSDAMETLGLHAGEIRGFNLNGEAASFTAQTIALDNDSGVSSSGAVSGSTDGYLELNAATITLGKNALHIDQFANVSLNATGVVAGTSSGSLSVGKSELPANLFITTPLITSTAGNSLMVTSSGDLTLQAPDLEYVTATKIQPGAGTTLSFTGATVSANTTLSAPSGKISIHATSGDVNVGGGAIASLDVSGVSKTIQTATMTADAGSISIQSDEGNVNLGHSSSMNLSASGSSSAGTLLISAPVGTLALDANSKLNATGGSTGGANGVFSLDVSTLDTTGQGLSLLSTIIPQLSPDENDIGGFTKSLSFRIRSGDVDVDTYVKSMAFSLSADQGLIDVTPNGVIDASGPTGGKISLQASGSVILEPNSFLNVHGDSYDNAGKGGSVFLSAGAEIGGWINPDAVLDLRTASSIDLGVTETTSRPDQFGGTLHLRAPITADGADIQVASLDATITGASSIAVEGYRLYDLTGTSGEITQLLRDQINTDAVAFFGQPRSDTTPATVILQRLTANQESGISNILNFAPGVDILNASGNLSLGSDWDLSVLRYGQGLSFTDASGESHTIGKDAGFLTLRATGDVVLRGSISDGFGDSMSAAVSTSDPNNSAANLCYKTLVPLAQDANGKVVSQKSWSYSIAAGADFSSASLLATSFSGSLKLGKPTENSNLIAAEDPSSTQLFTIKDFLSSYQVIRTGTGDISISAGGDIQLLNQFASIYTAGNRIVNATLSDKFDLPSATVSQNGLADYTTTLGKWQQPGQNEAQFSSGGGNITIQAGGNIAHLQLIVRQYDSQGNQLQEPYSSDPSLTADSSRQLPGNWLMRRGNTDANGNWKILTDPNREGYSEVASTAWWIDFANFFEGVATLGGGNVSMTALGSVMNVDVSATTQARMAARSDLGAILTPGAGVLIETGGGDITIKTGKNLDAGVYYAERGNIGIRVSGDIVSNKTRDVKGDYLYFLSDPGNRSSKANPSSGSYLPTSFLLGRGNISVVSGGDSLLGPVGNAFLLTQGIDNDVSYKTYFSTYDLNPEQGAPAIFQASSLGGDLNLRSTINGASTFTTWMLSDAVSSAWSTGNVQPWIRIADAFATGMGLMPASVSLSAMSGNISLQGSLSLVPSAFGNINLLAGGAINGLSPQGVEGRWISASINLSDASPKVIPVVINPLSSASGFTSDPFLMASLGASLAESGSFIGSRGTLQSKQQLHGDSLLHQNDTQPLQILAGLDISGITLFSPKKAQIMAGGDIADVGLYIQNTSVADVSTVTASGSIILYDHSTQLEQAAYNFNKNFAVTAEQKKALQTFWPWSGSGDIQISGPGSLIVTAGGNINLGNGPNNADGTGVGITSIGNARNQALPFEGADIQLMTGVKAPESLGAEKILASAASAKDSSRYFKEVSDALMQTGNNGLVNAFLTIHSWDELINSDKVGDDIKSRIAMVLFDILLRDTGRDFNEPNSPNYRSYASGEQAIANLFGVDYQYTGSVITWSRDLRTKNGGSITINAPRGGVTLANTTIGSTLAPPGIVTEHGGAINIFTKENVDIGIGRIFTLQGGDIMIWSDKGNIAAGSSAKTVASAPPTRVLIDPQSAAVLTDLAGLATGGGIGVLATVKDAPVGNVDLIAPSGYIDAGDAGIRASGNLTLAAPVIKNANNISAASTKGAPPAVAAPATAAPPASANTAAAANNKASQTISKNNASGQADEPPSIYSIDIIGYGGGDEGEEKKAADATVAPVQASL
jgi:filamentous hemagglutinin family protein